MFPSDTPSDVPQYSSEPPVAPEPFERPVAPRAPDDESPDTLDDGAGLPTDTPVRKLFQQATSPEQLVVEEVGTPAPPPTQTFATTADEPKPSPLPPPLPVRAAMHSRQAAGRGKLRSARRAVAVRNAQQLGGGEPASLFSSDVQFELREEVVKPTLPFQANPSPVVDRAQAFGVTTLRLTEPDPVVVRVDEEGMVEVRIGDTPSAVSRPPLPKRCCAIL